VVVVSAIDKTTDYLLETTNQSSIKEVPKHELDDILALGEITSSKVFSAVLEVRGQRSCYIIPSDPKWPIMTDDKFGNAEPFLSICEKQIRKHILPLLEDGFIVVIPGFVGSTIDGKITTMGRGGSDTTALILARALSVDQVILVTDVEGVLTADPKIIKHPRILSTVSINTLLGLANSGSKFVHKKALRFKSPKISIKIVNNSYGNLDSNGTTIYGQFPKDIVVDLYEKPVFAVTITGRKSIKASELITNIIQEINKTCSELLGMSVNSDSLILYLSSKKPQVLLENLHSIIINDKRTIAMAVRNELAFIRIKGIELEETPGVINEITEVLNSRGININGIFTITSSIIIFVDLKDKEITIHLIKETIE
jgi:aspartate kinase